MRLFLLLLATLGRAAIKSYEFFDRSLHLHYAMPGGKDLDHDDDVILNALDMVPGGLTMVTPVALNIDPSKFDYFMTELNKRNITICFGIGWDGREGWEFDSEPMQTLPWQFRKYTDCIRFEHWLNQAKLEGMDTAYKYLKWLKDDVGFKHLILNPWLHCDASLIAEGYCTEEENGKPFDMDMGDSNYECVILKQNWDPPYEIYDHEMNFKAPRHLRFYYDEYGNDFPQIVMYELPPQHDALAAMEEREPRSSIAAMNIAATQSLAASWFWQPPFTSKYDPLRYGTWSWIAKRIAAVSPPYEDLPVDPVWPGDDNGFYDAVLNLQYAGIGGTFLSNTDEEILAHLDEIEGGPSMIYPVVENVDPAQHDAFLTELSKRDMKFCLGIGMGANENWEFDSDNMLDKPLTFLPYTDCIVVLGFGAAAKEWGEDAGADYVRYLYGIGFTNIMLRPWGLCDMEQISEGKCAKEGAYEIPHATAASEHVKNDFTPLDMYVDPLVELHGKGFPIIPNYLADQLQSIAPYFGPEQSRRFKAYVDYADRDGKVRWAGVWNKNHDPIKEDTWGWQAEQLAAQRKWE